MPPRRAAFAFVAALLAFVSLFVAPPAWAKGVKAEKTTLEEDLDAHNWKLKLVLDFGSTPDRDVIPMSFSFKQTATYERTLTDESPNKPVMRTVPMVNQVPNISEQEVAFSDPGTGKRFAVTKFPITLRRKDDFEAGEYDLTIKVAGGATLGTVKLQLKGENKAIDRRSLNFSASVGAPKKKAEPEAKGAAPEKAGGAAEDQGPDLSDIPSAPKDAAASSTSEPNAPPPVPPKQGGCGCHLAGESPSGRLAGLSVLGVVAALVRRRRRV
jgi:MYXO-CTERM domain-containing protein